MDLSKIRDLGDRAWPVLSQVSRLHAKVYRLTGGRIGHRVFPGVPPFLLLEHVGARSGIRRTNALFYAADGADLVIVASKGGHPHNPAWYHNLLANPDTIVQVGSERRRVHARAAEGAERSRLWQLVVSVWSDYATYQTRADRTIPIVILRPATGT